jgi:acetylornithine aminotransferase
MGLMIGIELNQECNALVDIALKNKLLINVTEDSIIRLLPPLVINDDEAILLANKLITTMTEFFDEKE